MSEPIFTYKKKRAKQKIEIHVDYKMDPDGWFLDIQYIEIKTGKIAHQHCIIQKDLEGWQSGFVSDGWELVN